MWDDKTQRLADRLDILEVLAISCHVYDDKNAAAFASLFTEDAVFEAFRPGEATTPFLRCTSRAALQTFAEARFVQTAALRTRRDATSTWFLELNAATARTRSTEMLTWAGPGAAPLRLQNSGINLDDWRRTPDGWKIAQRVYVASWTSPPPPTE